MGVFALHSDRRLMQEAGTKRSQPEGDHVAGTWSRLVISSPRPAVPSEPRGAGVGLHPHRLGWDSWGIPGSRGSQVLGLYAQAAPGGDLSHSSLSSCPGAGPPHWDSGLPPRLSLRKPVSRSQSLAIGRLSGCPRSIAVSALEAPGPTKYPGASVFPSPA